MSPNLPFVFMLLVLWVPLLIAAKNQPTVADAQAWMKKAEAELLDIATRQQRATWVEETYITGDTEKIAAQANDNGIERTTRLVKESERFSHLDVPTDLKRKLQLLRLSLTLPAPNDPKLRAELTDIASRLEGTYGSGKYCPNEDASKCVGIDDLAEQMATNRNPEALAKMWTGWHKVGAPMRDDYARFVELSNEGARGLGFQDTGAMWRSGYDMSPEQFSTDIERLWQQVKPLYVQLHAYVRKRLIAKYGAAAERPDGLIPADLLGNMWAQEWGNIFDLVSPPDAGEGIDIGKILQARGTDARQVVRYGEGFFRSLGLEELPGTFWQRSQFVKPRDRDVVCHASAWHMDLDRDVRLKVCIHSTTDDFITVHHELGHVYYFLAYRDGPVLFRNGANDGFHEAIGDSIALSITPAYLKQIGLLEQIPSASGDIPQLLHTALDKVGFLPFGLLIDKWRWDVFAGKVKPADYNKAWWRLREDYQGVAPPVDRTESDFDPGAKYHVPDNTPYIRYFLARIYQFQFYKALCDASGYKGPLNRCSFYGSKQAGERLQAMLKLGQSQPWPEAMKAITGSARADAGPMLEYFQPLVAWLKTQNGSEAVDWTLPKEPMSASR